MVNELYKGKEKVYACGECNLYYNEKNLAEKCEKWCKNHKNCNSNITKYALKK